DRRVVVAPLRVGVELAGPIEQGRDARHAVGAIQGDLERPDRVPGELVTERQVDDALVIAFGIERLDRLQDVEAAAHRPTPVCASSKTVTTPVSSEYSAPMI